MWSCSLCIFWECCVLHIWGMIAIPTLVQMSAAPDVDECEDTTVCPAFSTCTNTVGSFYCTCKLGFQPSSGGQVNFRGTGVQCLDVDECAASPQPCGPHSVCMNLFGRFSCSCLPGFSSPAGKGWVPYKGQHFTCTDVDECLDGDACPAHALCINSPGSFRCVCQEGFVLRGTICQDVDECANPRACPENAVCYNSFGNYSCECKLGYESSSGRPMFKDLEESCRDVDECSENSTLCGPNSLCTNIPGEYTCSCLPGFSSAGVHTPGALKPLECTDMDECADGCPPNAVCTNTPGSYFCTCAPGFAPSNGQQDFTDPDVRCGDIDECSQDPFACGPNSACTNTPGSYSCTAGFCPLPESSPTHGNFSCKKVPFKCPEDMLPHDEQVQQCRAGAVPPERASFCSLMNATFSLLDATCRNRSTTVSLQSTAEHYGVVLEQTSTQTELTKEEASTLAAVLLESVESTTLAALLTPSANVSQTVQTEYLDIESKVINEECIEKIMVFHLKAKGDSIKIRCSVIEESGSAGTAGVAFVSFTSIESVLDEQFFQDPQASEANSKRKLKMNSRVVGGIITGEKKDNFSDPVIYTLEHLQPKQRFERPICVSWRTDEAGGVWTPSGCVTLEALETHTVCSCNRMANLAIIMASGELTMEFSLFVISHLGMSISLVCLVLAIATFLLCRTIRSHSTYLHLHLCVCLFLAKIIFLTCIDKTDNQIGCSIVAGVLHYLFLACFFWMLVEALTLFLMVRNLKVVNYFSSRNIKMSYLCAFGYGLPGLVVAVSASVQPRGYGTHNRCWLNTESGFIWSFLGPVCMIIVINSILLTWTLWILRQKLSSVNAEVSTLKDTRLLTFKAFAQLFVLGCSWVLGVFQIGPVASTMAYLFTIVNSLQGAFIFTIHCLLNRQVREQYRRWLCRKTKPSAQSQTSGMLMSSVPSASKTG